MPADFDIPIVIVGFGHSEDIVKCLTAVNAQRRCPKFEVFLCENGGAAAFDALEEALSQKGGPCEGGAQSVEPTSNDFVRARRLRLAGGGLVTIGQARDNLGFAGGTNAWVRPLLAEPSWTAVWILNPDTFPEPDALAELVDYAREARQGHGRKPADDPWQVRRLVVPRTEMEQAQHDAHWTRHVRAGVACS